MSMAAWVFFPAASDLSMPRLRRMIRERIWRFSQKFLPALRRITNYDTLFLHFVNFLGRFWRIRRSCTGDVTPPFASIGSGYANRYAEFPQLAVKNESAGIPVENSEFSTFSTSFSTGVFHRDGELWIFIFGSHKTV